MEFITKFFDFFDYYEVSEETKANYLHIHLVYENFYHFINKLRYDMPCEEENSYAYVFENLEACLRFTDHADENRMKYPSSRICDLSHRKYAEMYYFYKFYLLRTGKTLPKDITVDMATYEGSGINTNVRFFLSYIQATPAVQPDFDNVCA